MKNTERTIVYTALGVCLLLGLSSMRQSVAGWGAGAAGGAAMASPSADATTGIDDKPVKIAVCDIYGVAEKLVDSDRFKPDREAEEARLRELLKPMETQLAELQREIEAMDPKDEAAQAKASEFRAKREAFARAEQQAAGAFGAFVSRQYLDAFELARASAITLAGRESYTHVLASRDAGKRIETLNPERMVEAFLGRPVIMAPEGTDITDDLLADLRLE